MAGEDRYAFGDTPEAADRLAVLADVFAAPSRDLLDSLEVDPRVVLDLGCGPGHTTTMLGARFPDAEVVGLDLSVEFLARARDAGIDGCVFEAADITRLPLPHAPADVAYARFVLTHLRRPRALLEGWTSQLAPGGVVALEEPAVIESDHDVFRRYLRLAERMIGKRGGQLYVGGTLPSRLDGVTIVLDRLVSHRVPRVTGSHDVQHEPRRLG